jgi:hypothetical protein
MLGPQRIKSDYRNLRVNPVNESKLHGQPSR